MLTFEFTARDTTTGEQVKSELQAESENAAAKLITAQGYSPLSIRAKGTGDGLIASIKKRVSSKDKVVFSRQLATLINAGLPLTQSLRTVQEQSANKEMAAIVGKVIVDVEAGNSFADSLTQHPRVFNTVYTSLVAAGEASGTLDEALERIANQQEKDAEVRSKVRGAFVYPIIVLVVIAGVIVFMLTTVLPQVEQLYDDLNQQLPLITKIMLFASNIITSFWWLIILGSVFAGYVLFKYVQTPPGRAIIDSLKMSVPLFGKLFMKMYMARFCRTGQTLMSTGVPMLEMMRITGKAVDNVHIERTVTAAAEEVKGGKALSDAIKDKPTFLPLVPQMIHIGEQSGTIDAMMGKAATFYENELDNEIKTISTTIEPILMVFLAIVAASMVGAILIPIYGLVGQSVI